MSSLSLLVAYGASWLPPFHPSQVLLTEHLLELTAPPHDDSKIHGPTERRIEDILGVDFLVESIDGDHDGWALEAFEAGDGAVEDVVGGPQVLPVGVAVGVAAFGVDGVAAFGGQQGHVFGEPAFAVGELFDGVVSGWDHVFFVGEDEADWQPFAAFDGHLAITQRGEGFDDLPAVAVVGVEVEGGHRDVWAAEAALEDRLAVVAEHREVEVIGVLRHRPDDVPPGIGEVLGFVDDDGVELGVVVEVFGCFYVLGWEFVIPVVLVVAVGAFWLDSPVVAEGVQGADKGGLFLLGEFGHGALDHLGNALGVGEEGDGHSVLAPLAGLLHGEPGLAGARSPGDVDHAVAAPAADKVALAGGHLVNVFEALGDPLLHCEGALGLALDQLKDLVNPAAGWQGLVRGAVKDLPDAVSSFLLLALGDDRFPAALGAHVFVLGNVRLREGEEPVASEAAAGPAWLALDESSEGMPAAACLAGRIDLLGALFAGLVPGAVGVSDGAALDLNYSDAGVRHEDDEVDFDVAVGVVVQAQAGDDDIVFGEVALDGFADLALSGCFLGIAAGDVTSHVSPMHRLVVGSDYLTSGLSRSAASYTLPSVFLVRLVSISRASGCPISADVWISASVGKEMRCNRESHRGQLSSKSSAKSSCDTSLPVPIHPHSVHVWPHARQLEK